MALISLNRCKEFQPNTSSADDAALQSILNASSDLIEKSCNRFFAVRSYDEIYSGLGEPTLLLAAFPVVSVERVATNLRDAVIVRNTDDAAVRASVAVTSTGLTLVSVASGVTTTSSLAFATYVTLSALVTAINLVSGWTATVNSGFETWASADLKAVQGAFNGKLNCALRVFASDLSSFQVREDIGELFSPWRFYRGHRNFRVTYTAGFAEIPEPIQQACAELCAATFLARGLNPNLTSESIGGYSYSQAVQKGYQTLSTTAQKAISLYRNSRIVPFRII